MPNNLKELEGSLWEAADQLRANSHLKSSEYSVPALGLIFLRYADEQLKARFAIKWRSIIRDDYQELSVVYLPENARLKNFLKPIPPNSMDRNVNWSTNMYTRFSVAENKVNQ